jgi:predicted nucleotidyltransferase component of viral defense system
MLTVGELRHVAARSGARDIGKAEIDVILTHLLQLFVEKGITEHVAFKGGTMLRKMVFGPRGRLSTDLDFTRRSDIELDDLMMMMLEALNFPRHRSRVCRRRLDRARLGPSTTARRMTGYAPVADEAGQVAGV